MKKFSQNVENLKRKLKERKKNSLFYFDKINTSVVFFTKLIHNGILFHFITINEVEKVLFLR